MPSNKIADLTHFEDYIDYCRQVHFLVGLMKWLQQRKFVLLLEMS